jgi:RimJ/RimL family protein N-acetyltransferase
MTELFTDRLKLKPLNKCELELAIKNFNDLEKELGAEITKENIGPREQSVYKIRLNDMKTNMDLYKWYTPWVLIESKLNRIIGAIMIKNYPDENGEVIIGYALQESFRRKGYMREGVSALIEWILNNDDVKFVVADTLKSNIASHGLLKQIGMTIYKEDEECYWWRIEKSNSRM